MRFLAGRKAKAIVRIFPTATVTFDRKYYIVYDAGLVAITEKQTKELEKRRLRITSVDFEQGKIILQRKLKVFDWFLVYAGMRIIIGSLLIGSGLFLL